MITGDSLEYEFLDNAVKQLKDPIGVSVELGVRRGQGSKTIIDAYRKYHPNTFLTHLGIDPYGNIKYNTHDSNLNVRLDYTNSMRQDMLQDFSKDYPEFNFVNLEDVEFFKRYEDYYPIYNNFKINITKYEIVHFDGPHDTASVLKEVEFFEARKPEQCVYIFDDVDNFDIDSIGKYLEQKDFKILDNGGRKRSYEYKT